MHFYCCRPLTGFYSSKLKKKQMKQSKTLCCRPLTGFYSSKPPSVHSPPETYTLPSPYGVLLFQTYPLHPAIHAHSGHVLRGKTIFFLSYNLQKSKIPFNPLIIKPRGKTHFQSPHVHLHYNPFSLPPQSSFQKNTTFPAIIRYYSRPKGRS